MFRAANLFLCDWKFTAALQLRKTQLKHFKQIHITELYLAEVISIHIYSQPYPFLLRYNISLFRRKIMNSWVGTLECTRREDLTMMALKSLCIMRAWSMWLESGQMHLSNHHVLEEKLAMVYSPSLNDHPVFKHVWTIPRYVTQMAAVITDVPQPAFTTHSHTKTH